MTTTDTNSPTPNVKENIIVNKLPSICSGVHQRTLEAHAQIEALYAARFERALGWLPNSLDGYEHDIMYSPYKALLEARTRWQEQQ